MESKCPVVLLVAAVTVTTAAAERDSVLVALDRAAAAESKHDDDNAERLYREAVARFPDKGGVHFHLGRFLTKRGRCSEALPEFEVLLSIGKPADRLAEARVHVHDCLISLGIRDWGSTQEPASLTRFIEVVNRFPSSGLARFHLGMRLGVLGRCVEAREHLERATGSPSLTAKQHAARHQMIENCIPAREPSSPKGRADEFKYDNSRFTFRIALGLGWQAGGDRNANLHSFTRISTWTGDYRDTSFEFSALRGFNERDAVRFRLGGQTGINFSNGNQNTGGSTTQSASIGPRIELDWDRVYRGGFRNRLRGPSSLGLFAKGGYGWGTSTIDGGFELHKVSGLAVTVGADLNLANITVLNKTLGIELYAYRSIIYSSQANFGVESLGLMTVVRR